MPSFVFVHVSNAVESPVSNVWIMYFIIYIYFAVNIQEQCAAKIIQMTLFYAFTYIRYNTHAKIGSSKGKDKTKTLLKTDIYIHLQDTMIDNEVQTYVSIYSISS